MDATTTLVKLLTLCLVFTLSEAPVLALCLYKMPPHDGRRTTDQFQAYVPVVFENDGQYYGTTPEERAFSSAPCIRDGLTAGWQDAGISVGLVSYPTQISIQPMESLFQLSAFTTRSPSFSVTSGGVIDVPQNVSKLSLFNCDRIKKLIRHEVGHVMGLNHPETLYLWQIRFPRWHLSIMHAAKATPDNTNGIDDLPLNPTCGDINAAKEAAHREGPPNANGGDIAECGIDEWSDDHGCCHPKEVLLYSSSVGHLNRRPTIHITEPANGTSFAPWATLNFVPHAMDSDGPVKRVFWAYRAAGAPWTWVETWSYPFSLTAQNVPPGSYEVKAEAEDYAGAWGFSAPVNVVVASPPSGPGVLQSGAILYPDQVRTSPNGLNSVVYHAASGNFVFYQWGTPLVGTGNNLPAGGVYMNPNGALEVYNAYQQRVWTSATDSAANAGSYFRVSDDGRIAIVRPNGAVAWQFP